MSNIYALPSQEAMYDQASEWIAKLDRGLSSSEEEALVSWLELHDKHRDILFEMASVWDSMDSLSRLSSLFPPPTKSVVHKSGYQRLYFAAAASVLVVMMIGVLGVMTYAPSQASGWLAAFNINKNIDGVYDTSVGEHSRVNLPDGSELVLNTNSRIQVKYTDDARLFFLERGEVHIDVAHDKSRPLSVIAGDKVVQAVGTAFNVQIFNDREVELIVTDGKVLVAEHDANELFETIEQAPLPVSSLAVSQGEKIVLGSEKEKVDKIQDADIEASLSWRQGNLVFRGETLEEALAEITRYTDVEFEIRDDAVRSVRIAGLFKAGDIKGLLATLRQNFHIDHQKLNNNKVTLTSI
ncbi:MAG: FecR domain-containing protein [Agarilytica sp.]